MQTGKPTLGAIMKTRFLLIITTLIFVISADLAACGDSLYRVGKGVSYRVYTAPLPGSVLVYGDSESAQQLAEALALSGHGVRVVENELDLGLELQSGNYDVVIAAYSDHAAVESSAGSTAFLPVAMDKNEAAIAKGEYGKVLVADRDELKHYLKAIHKSLKSKT
jgi:hypothetical protein